MVSPELLLNVVNPNLWYPRANWFNKILSGGDLMPLYCLAALLSVSTSFVSGQTEWPRFQRMASVSDAPEQRNEGCKISAAQIVENKTEVKGNEIFTRQFVVTRYFLTFDGDENMERVQGPFASLSEARGEGPGCTFVQK